MGISAEEYVKRILAATGCAPIEPTRDTFKWGDPATLVRGVATAFVASLDVLQRAAAKNLNLVIAHEPTFYDDAELKGPLGEDAVVEAKKAFLKEHGLVVWRFHDYWHRRKPDGIREGIVAALQWQTFQNAENPSLFAVPEMSLQALAEMVKARLGAKVVRVVGKPGMRCRGIALAPGFPGSQWQMKLLQRADVDVLVTGETREWETNEYVRDAASAGMNKGLILAGHCNSEEAGMGHLAGWLKTVVPEVKAEFVPAGDPFW
jgi:putative NIF3 family GTP cyclohydrolase 1 type 2